MGVMPVAAFRTCKAKAGCDQKSFEFDKCDRCAGVGDDGRIQLSQPCHFVFSIEISDSHSESVGRLADQKVKPFTLVEVIAFAAADAEE